MWRRHVMAAFPCCCLSQHGKDGPPFGRALLSMPVASCVATGTALRAAIRSLPSPLKLPPTPPPRALLRGRYGVAAHGLYLCHEQPVACEKGRARLTTPLSPYLHQPLPCPLQGATLSPTVIFPQSVSHGSAPTRDTPLPQSASTDVPPAACAPRHSAWQCKRVMARRRSPRPPSFSSVRQSW